MPGLVLGGLLKSFGICSPALNESSYGYLIDEKTKAQRGWGWSNRPGSQGKRNKTQGKEQKQPGRISMASRVEACPLKPRYLYSLPPSLAVPVPFSFTCFM